MTAEPVTVAAQLRDLLDWAALLPVLLTRHAPSGDSSRGGRAPSGSKPPVRLDVLQVLDARVRIPGDDAEDRAELDRLAGDHRQGLLPDLWQWARLIEAEAMETCPQVPAELPEQPTLGSVVDWLLVHTGWAETQQWADEYRADVDWWWRRLRQLVGEARAEPVVPCGRCGEALTQQKPGLWECEQGHMTSVQAVTLREAARILSARDGEKAPTLRTLQRWAKRPGLLIPISDGPRSRLFDLSQICTVNASRLLDEGA